MSHAIKERIKTISIYILLISGLLQVGILWSYQNQGAPINHLLGLIFGNGTQISNETVREHLFTPDKIVVSDGEYSNSHWVIKQRNEYYNGFWSEAATGLQKIVDGKISISVSGEEWDDIVEKRGFLVDFGYTIEPELLRWFLGTGNSSIDMPSFRKLMIRRDIINDDIGTFYFYGTDGTVYSSKQIRFEKAIKHNHVTNYLNNDANQLNRRYYSFSGSNIQKAEDEPDVLYVAVSPRYWPYNGISVKPPERAEIKEELEDILLGSDAGRYNKYTFNEGVIQYTYGSNIYRYHLDGYLTYRYLGSTEQKPDTRVEEALLNAYQFVGRTKELYESEADIALTLVEKKAGGVYKFTFDYRIDGMPIKVEYGMKDGSGNKLNHAISILADNRRVLECDWLIKNFKQYKTGFYNDRMLELMGRERILFDDIDIQQIDTGYYVSNAYTEFLEPALIIETKDKESKEKGTIVLNLLPEEGD